MLNARHVARDLASVFCALAISGCFAPAPKPYPAWHQQFRGFSVIVPGEEWQEDAKSQSCADNQQWSESCERVFMKGNGILLLKTEVVPSERVQGGLNTHSADFQNDPLWVKAEKEPLLIPTVVSRKLQPDRTLDMDCLYLHEELRFTGAGSLLGLYPSSLFASGYVCSHPDHRNYVVWVECGQVVARYDAPVQGLELECEGVLSSLSFTKLP
jgi:hypothetical protein